MRSKFTHRLKRGLVWLGNILLALLIIAVGEWLPLMPAVQRFQEDHLLINQILTAGTLAMTVLGTLLLAFTQFLVRVPGPRPANWDQTVKTEGIVKGPGNFFSGKMISAGFSDEVRFWRMRKAFKDGDWWRVPRWRRLTLMMLGAILLFYGLFGLLFLLFPPGLKFFLFLLVVYATVRSVYGFIKDQPFRINDNDPHG
jgi:hypothetical protein